MTDCNMNLIIPNSLALKPMGICYYKFLTPYFKCLAQNQDPYLEVQQDCSKYIEKRDRLITDKNSNKS